MNAANKHGTYVIWYALNMVCIMATYVHTYHGAMKTAGIYSTLVESKISEYQDHIMQLYVGNRTT